MSILLATFGGAVLAIVVMRAAPDASAVKNALWPPTSTPTATTTPTPIDTPTPTDTPLPTATETPDPNPLHASCGVYASAMAQMLDDYDERSRVDSSDLELQYGVARAIPFLAAAAEDRRCDGNWTDLRRRFSFIADQLENQFNRIEDLKVLQEGYNKYAVRISEINHCKFYSNPAIYVINFCVKLENLNRADGPEEKLLSRMYEILKDGEKSTRKALGCDRKGK